MEEGIPFLPGEIWKVIESSPRMSYLLRMWNIIQMEIIHCFCLGNRNAKRPHLILRAILRIRKVNPYCGVICRERIKNLSDICDKHIL